MKRLPKEDRAGLYITVIVHLVVIIILLVSGLDRTLSKENTFVLDFTKLDQLEKLQKEVSMREAISRKLEDMIAGATPVRNVAVDRSALKDDRGTNAKELYRDAEKLQEELGRGYKLEEEDVSVSEPRKEEKKQEEKHYSGPSVLSWELEGRKASKLPIPAYRCMGAGEVKIIIGVNPTGAVISANIDESASSKDGCLRTFAVRAARLSRFSASASAPARQQGYITYQFIAQ